MTEIITKDLMKHLTQYFDGKDAVRENALKTAREISKNSTAIIRKLHNKNPVKPSELSTELKNIGKKYKELKTSMRSYPELYYSTMIENYIQEYAEATIMLALIKNNLDVSKLPDPDKLGIPYITYLMGLGDVIGEFRRCCLDALRNQQLSEATRCLDTMEELYEIIINLNYPDKVLPLRRKQDIARALIEKTRSELVFAMSENNLVENISELKSDLKLYYKNVVRKN